MCSMKTRWRGPKEPDLPKEVEESVERFAALEDPILAPLSLPVDIPVLPRSLPECWADLSLDLDLEQESMGDDHNAPEELAG